MKHFFSRFRFKCLFLFRSFSTWEMFIIANHWRYQRYHELLRCSIWCIKACMNLYGTEWLVEIDWKNFDEDWKSSVTVFKKWQKNTCERAAFLGTLQAATIFQRIFCILMKLILPKQFCRNIQKYTFFFMRQ